MKKVYIAPSVEFELYELDASIAQNCGIIVDNGPEMTGHEVCQSYIDEVEKLQSLSRRIHNVVFYEDLCDCYTTGGGDAFWTS